MREVVLAQLGRIKLQVLKTRQPNREIQIQSLLSRVTENAALARNTYQIYNQYLAYI